ncbi:MAG: hypothetical protein NTZ72_08405 [Afipia sp.]|nr:hypothetical protein [Afipia sp.]
MSDGGTTWRGFSADEGGGEVISILGAHVCTQIESARFGLMKA